MILKHNVADFFSSSTTNQEFGLDKPQHVACTQTSEICLLSDA